MSAEKQDCPECGEPCWRDDADVGVGTIYGLDLDGIHNLDAWDYDDWNGMSDTWQASHADVKLCIESYSDGTFWSVNKSGTVIRGEAGSISAAQQCAIVACKAMLDMFAALAQQMVGGAVVPVDDGDEDE